MLTRETFIGPWAGLPVAWTEDNTFDEDTYRADVARCCEAKIPGVYSGGTTGEFYAMEFDEFQAVTKATVEECKRHGTPCMIGCSSTYTLGVVRRVEFARQMGADAVQIALPFWMETPDAEIVPFFAAASAAAGDDVAISIYETMRAKKALTLAQHQAIKKAVPQYMMVKANANTLGASVDGCKQLSEFVNVFSSEHYFAKFGPVGQIGACSALVYWNPRIMLAMWQDVLAKKWDAVKVQCESFEKLVDFLINGICGERVLLDTALDRLGGVSSGFLKTSLRSRGPYPSTTQDDVEALRAWYAKNWPEMLEL